MRTCVVRTPQDRDTPVEKINSHSSYLELGLFVVEPSLANEKVSM